MQKIALEGACYEALEECYCTACALYPGDQEKIDRFTERAQDDLKARQERARALKAKYGSWNRSWWEADHDNPVHLGGGECGPENFRTRCTVCHKAKSAREAAERARVRREQKEAASPQGALSLD